MTLDPGLAASFARIALGHVVKPYPYKMDHVLASEGDVCPPRHFHPIFFGSFDWHSCVHGWWTLLTIRRLFPDTAEALDIAALADTTFTREKASGERAYLDRPTSRGFERPYGWAWLLYLHLEADRHHDKVWGVEIDPLARAFAERLRAYLPLLTYPIRVGTHFNTAFALVLSLEWADNFDEGLAALIRERVMHWFGADRDCQAWEPGGDDFLSSTLIEALCMMRAHESSFPDWFRQFLPSIARRMPTTLFEPALVSDRADGKIAHLDGLNLSRAWCWRWLSTSLAPAERSLARSTADKHVSAALQYVSGDYMGEHWLASFATLAMLAPE